MSMAPITEIPDEPPCCDDEIHLPPIEFPVLPDPALRNRCQATPDSVHIRHRSAA